MKRKSTVILTIILMLSLMSMGFSMITSAETSGAMVEYSITYHLDGGTNSIKNPDMYIEEDVIVLADAQKSGYVFAGWFLDSAMTEQITEISNMTENLDLYAKFVPETYQATFSDGVTLTFKVAGFEDYILYLTRKDTETYRFDPYAPEIIKRYTSNYGTFPSSDPNFDGWYYDAERTEKITGLTFVRENMTLYGSFNNRTSTTASGMFKGGTSATYYNDDVDKAYRVPTLADPDSKLTISFEISCRSSYKTSSKVYYTYYSAAFTIYNVTQGKEIYYRYWPAGTGCSTRTDTITVSVNPGDVLRFTNGSQGYDSDTTYAKITFSGLRRESALIDAGKSTDQSVTFGEPFDKPTANSRLGYSFLGWYDSDGNKAPDIWQFASNRVFYSKWQPTKYYITYELNGGRNNASNPSSYTINDSITLRNPSKPGHTFEGWYSDPNFKTKVTKISGKTENITLYAKYVVNSYDLTLDGNGGQFAPLVTFVSDGEVIKQTYLYEGDSLTAYRPANKEGYIFSGWYKDSGLTKRFEFNGTITDDITLYAKWIECNESVICVESLQVFDAEIQGKNEKLYAFVPMVSGRIVVQSESDGLDLMGILYNASMRSLTSGDDISDSDLDFSFSYNVTAGNLYYIAVKGARASVSGDATVKINWSGECTLTGTTYPNRFLTKEYKTSYQLPVKPIREGYVFLGWFDESDNQIADNVWDFSADKTLTAKWEPASYHTVVFKDIDGNVISTQTYYLSQDIVAPELPTKPTDKSAIYTAKWDNNYTGICTGDAVYSPIFEAKYIDYSVVFKDWDGKVLLAETYHFGDKITSPEAPTKAADKTYTYVFAGWDKAVGQCDGDAVYTAVYTSTYIDYTVTFKDYDGSTIHSATYHYGDAVNIPSAPTRAANKTYTYSFAGWSTDVSTTCKGNAAYTATYTPVYIDYTVTFKNYDGTVLGTAKYHYGDTIKTVTSPTRAADKTYTYRFDGWDKTPGTCVGNETFTATYTRTYIEYTVTFKNYNNSIISQKQYHYNDTVQVPSTVPTKAADKTYTYTFAGWDKSVTACTGNVTYTAQFTPVYINYTVTFKNDDGTVLSTRTYHYGDAVAKPSNPQKAADKTYTYTFNGWDRTVSSCMGNATYTATYTRAYINYTVTFRNDDGTVLSTKTYHYGDTVTKPTNPTKAADKTYTYTFAGWDKTVVPCNGDATYKATYTKSFVEYTVEFKNYDGTVISSKTYHYGDTVTLPSKPTKPSDSKFYYTFTGWDRSVSACYGNAVYTATFTAAALPPVTVQNVTARAEETVSVNLVLSDAPDLETLSISNILYDASVFELVDVEWKTVGATLSKWDKDTGKGAVAYAAPTDLNGTILSLVFRVKSNAADGKYPVSCTVTSSECDLKSVPGEITVWSVAPGDVDGSETLDKNDAIYLLMHCFFPEEYPINQTADYDGNGTLDKDDAIHLLMHVFFPDDYPLAPAPTAVMALTGERKREEEE